LKKRHTALFLAFVLLLTTLCACGQQAEQTEQAESNGGEQRRGAYQGLDNTGTGETFA
jgi:hypothetical protein